MAGCLGDDDDELVLDPTDGSPGPSTGIPAYGDQLPSVELSSPLHDQDVDTEVYIGQRHQLYTFVSTRCPSGCPQQAAALAAVQMAARSSGVEESVVCLPVTFDPDHDGPDELEEFSTGVGADPTAESWQFLRPATTDEAESVVSDTFGVTYEPTDDDLAFSHVPVVILANKDGLVERTYAGTVPTAETLVNDATTVWEAYD